MESLERFVYIVLLIILFCYYNANECRNSDNQGQCNLRPCNRLLKRDFKYYMFVFLALIILLLTARLGDDSQLLNYISFGSTLTSIILSILAIFMTMLAESKSDATKTRLENLTSIIEKSSESIEKQVDDINNIYKEMAGRFPVYEKILTQQATLMEKMESLEERTKNIEEGIKKKNFEGDVNACYAKKRIVRKKDGEK